MNFSFSIFFIKDWLMKQHLVMWGILLSLSIPVAAQQQSMELSMGKVSLQFQLSTDGQPLYSLNYDQKPVVRPSVMGFVLKETDSVLYSDFTVLGTELSAKDETWQPVWGEVSTIRNNYKQMIVHLQQRHAPFRLLDIEFRVFEDGAGFRYVFPHQPKLNYFIVSKELTAFQLTGDHTAFWIPGDYDTNEYLYNTTHLSEIDNRKAVETATDIAVRTTPDPYAVQTPLMLKSADGLYINIHEAALLNYSAMQLHVDRSSFSLTASLVPDAVGNLAYLHAPASTPWRTIIVSDKAADILNSKLVLNLNEPNILPTTDWIRPMKFAGVWWEMQVGKSTWSISDRADTTDTNGNLIPNGRHGANSDNVKRYIDFAAKNGIHGVLIEGWNTGWEDWFGNWKEEVFDFVTPYPDFNVKELNSYARSKGVELIMHHETSGSATNYDRRMDSAFRFMKENGYHSVKTGYVGRIIPRGEAHDGQWMVNHFERMARKAASYQISFDAHEAMRPTGLHRTFPNWMACEAGRGNEYNAFSTGSPPEHETILPFTRLIGGPMDYTPGIFKMKGYCGYAPDRQMHTTLVKQLALYVTMYSPLQMVADFPEHYEAHDDAFQFIRDVPVDWDDTKVIAAEPGDYVAYARKEKGKENWFIGAITDENSRKMNTPLSFLEKGKQYLATIYADAPGADWKTNPEAYVIKQFLVDQQTVLKLNLAPGGGAAISIKPLTAPAPRSVTRYK
ncbi:MAG: glycoside hydrolase family 97 protein [Chitinophagaceae bacterium]|nr:glycoside hydrolase family 97 protein [Chitinophagaceae bacterium]